MNRKIGFGSAMSLFVFLSILYLSINPFNLSTIKDLVWVFAYTLIPLASANLIGMEELYDDLRNINRNDSITPEKKIELMRNSLELQVEEWYSIWRKLEDEDEDIISKTKDTFMGFFNGKMTLIEGLFVVIYFQYIAIIRSRLIQVGSPYDFLIQGFSFFVVLIFTSKKSVAKTFIKIWEIVWSETDDWESKLRRIEHIIKLTTHQIFLNDLCREESEGSD